MNSDGYSSFSRIKKHGLFFGLATVLGLVLLFVTNEFRKAGNEAIATRQRLHQLELALSSRKAGDEDALAPTNQRFMELDQEKIAACQGASDATQKRICQLEREIVELKALMFNATQINNDIEKLKNDSEPIWAAIHLLEHGVQKANNDFTPFWPLPPKECKISPRQREIRPMNAHVKEQLRFGPMVKMALLADKVRVRDIVRSFNCPNLHLVPILGVWDVKNITSIDLSKLPSSYVLKANHGAGFIVIVKENIVRTVTVVGGMNSPETLAMKALRDKPIQTDVVIRFFQYALTRLYRDCFEPHYAFIDRLVFAEDLIYTRSGLVPTDFKLFSTKGKFLFAKLFFDRFVNYTHGFVDRKYTILEGYKAKSAKKTATQAQIDKVKPKRWNHMVEIAECLTDNIYRWGGIRFARVDLYDWDDRITLGEITLTPLGGSPSVNEPEHELELGAQFDI